MTLGIRPYMCLCEVTESVEGLNSAQRTVFGGCSGMPEELVASPPSSLTRGIRPYAPKPLVRHDCTAMGRRVFDDDRDDRLLVRDTRIFRSVYFRLFIQLQLQLKLQFITKHTGYAIRESLSLLRCKTRDSDPVN